ncbi:MAG: toprim domain-containing protein [Ekhidna sp.]|nr:toprim domain-containing protein [Ekhidna sp.]
MNVEIPVMTPSYEFREHSLVPGRHRGISTDTFNKFGVEADIDYGTGAAKTKSIIFPYTNANGDKIAEKADILRFRHNGGSKSMPLDKDQSTDISQMCLFGMDKFSPGGMKVTVTEGEYDALSVYQMMGDYPVVSIPLGTDSAMACLKNKANIDFLNSFGEIVVAFDNDVPGQKAAEEFANFFLGKAKIMKMDKTLKDANGYLSEGKRDAFYKAWWSAVSGPFYTPGDIVLGMQMKDEIINEEPESYVPYPFQGLNEMLYGMHTPEVILMTAEPKVGKSLVTGVLANHLMQHDENILVADLSIEDTPKRRMKTLLSLHSKKALHKPEVRINIPDEHLASHYDELFGNNQYYGYDNFGAQNAQQVLDRIKYFVEICGCKYVILDHISFLASYHDQDERKALDQMSNQLAQMATNLDFCLIVVAHLNREGKVHGSSNLEKTCYVHIDLKRDKDNDDPEIRSLVEMRVKLNRRYGETGKCYAKFSMDPYELRDIDMTTAKRILGEEDND